MSGTTDTVSRRDVARAIGRAVALAGLAVGSALLVLRPRSDCSRSDPCSGCGLRGDCDLPRARRAKEPRR